KLMVERSNGGAWDYARVQINGTTVYESPSGPSDFADPAWTLQDLDISAQADGNPAVRVRYTLKSDGSVTYGGWNIDDFKVTGLVLPPVAVDLSIYDVRGRQVKTVLHETREAGRHEIRWDGRGSDGHALATGVYFYRL